MDFLVDILYLIGLGEAIVDKINGENKKVS